ncbi:hypothetical protein WISP_122966 [Willisornis vidua]|uniref:Uncharacterized protein n=1 Tax=Willisornis vidua TaxID=1566151 RepID=A0ABQ9CUW2_9PASS|nr:hypothetical protein WISP_122966 [Willisornis vidua]
MVLQSSHRPCIPPLDLLQQLHVLLTLEASELDVVFQTLPGHNMPDSKDPLLPVGPFTDYPTLPAPLRLMPQLCSRTRFKLLRPEKLHFPKADLLGLPSHTATSLRNVFEVDLKKRIENSFLPLCGLNNFFPHRLAICKTSSSSIKSLCAADDKCSDGKAGVQQGSLRLLAAGKFPAGLQDTESILKRISKTSAGWWESFVLSGE